jgi:methanogenic corrinoid protein MtbC1
MSKLTDITNALADLNEDQALQLVREALQENIAPGEVLRACQEGMNEVGSRFEKQDYFVSDLIMSGEIFKQISAVLGPQLKAGGLKSTGKVVFGTVKGDIHDIGKDIVVNMMKSAGLEVLDVGVDCPSERFIEALKETGAPVLGMSGLLTLAFDSMKETIELLKKEGMRDKVKVMVGGAPVDATVCRAVGADDWGADAQAAVRLSKAWNEKAAKA